MASRTSHAGFTLIELIVTMAIVAILVAIGFPSFQGTMRSNRVATATNDLMASLSLARSEATRNPNGAAICTSTAGATCDSASWNDGWMVFIDVDGDGAVDPGERVVRFTEASDDLTVTAASAGSTSLVRFDSRGRANRLVTLTMQPTSCPSGNQLVRVLSVTPSGQVRTVRGSCV